MRSISSVYFTANRVRIDVRLRINAILKRKHADSTGMRILGRNKHTHTQSLKAVATQHHAAYERLHAIDVHFTVATYEESTDPAFATRILSTRCTCSLLTNSSSVSARTLPGMADRRRRRREASEQL